MSALSEAMRAKWKDPEWRARRLVALSNSHHPNVPMPRWVPAELRDDYRDIARLYGEEIAAREIRRMKAEAA